MIQLGSGVFECNIDSEIIRRLLSGELQFLNNKALCSTEEKLLHFDETSDDSLLNVSEHEIYSILENNGFNLGFKNITNFNIYKNIIQGYVRWENDWINFLEGLFKFPYLEHLCTENVLW